MNRALRRASIIRPVGWPSASSSQRRAGFVGGVEDRPFNNFEWWPQRIRTRVSVAVTLSPVMITGCSVFSSDEIDATQTCSDEEFKRAGGRVALARLPASRRVVPAIEEELSGLPAPSLRAKKGDLEPGEVITRSAHRRMTIDPGEPFYTRETRSRWRSAALGVPRSAARLTFGPESRLLTEWRPKTENWISRLRWAQSASRRRRFSRSTSRTRIAKGARSRRPAGFERRRRS